MVDCFFVPWPVGNFVDRRPGFRSSEAIDRWVKIHSDCSPGFLQKLGSTYDNACSGRRCISARTPQITVAPSFMDLRCQGVGIAGEGERAPD